MREEGHKLLGGGAWGGDTFPLFGKKNVFSGGERGCSTWEKGLNTLRGALLFKRGGCVNGGGGTLWVASYSLTLPARAAPALPPPHLEGGGKKKATTRPIGQLSPGGAVRGGAGEKGEGSLEEKGGGGKGGGRP